MSNITYVLSDFSEFQAGCFQVRVQEPFLQLQKMGHNVDYVIQNEYQYPELDKTDVVLYSRTYTKDPFRALWKHRLDGKKIVYDIDDDVFNIPKLNPAHEAYKDLKNQVEGLCIEADLVITSTEALKKVIEKNTPQRNIKVIENGINLNKFRKVENKELRIGWTGGANHYEDINIILDVIIDLQKEYDFKFIIQGLTGSPWDADAYSTNLMLRKGVLEGTKKDLYEFKMKIYEKFRQMKNFKHIPFYPPEMYPDVLSKASLDIGLIPIMGHEFDNSKSLIKYLEYTATGAAVLASNEPPYSGNVINTTKNKYNNWKKELTKLITNEKYRKDLAAKQHKQLFPKYEIQNTGKVWDTTIKELLKVV